MDKLFTTPAQIQGISTLKDKTMKLVVYVSRELSGEEKAKLFDLEQLEGYFLFSPNHIQMRDVPTDQAKMSMDRKSPSERLYNVMYVYYSQNFSDNNFNQWREQEMEKYIEDWKTKLRPNY